MFLWRKALKTAHFLDASEHDLNEETSESKKSSPREE
jgi:hypothetical protein